MTGVHGLPLNMQAMIQFEECPVAGLDGPCWAWTGRLTVKRYAAIRGRLGHRVIYELLIGNVPDGLELDHRCFQRHCVSPHHLEPVTHRENLDRSVAVRTHCKRGHPFDATNTMPCNGKSARRCRACYLMHAEEQERRRRAEPPAPPRPPRTHCRRGHDLSITGVSCNGGRHRRCGVCANEWRRAYYLQVVADVPLGQRRKAWNRTKESSL